MAKRRYTNIKAVESEILKMRAAGKTRREIADTLGLDITQIKNWIFRYNRQRKNTENEGRSV